MQIIDHLLSQVECLISSNQDARPAGRSPSLIIVHGISLPAGHFGGPYIQRLFTNQLDCSLCEDFVSLEGLRVSAHVLIRRDGQIIQFVPFNRRAWHAGVSQYAGEPDCNNFSIGIELEGVDDQSYAPEQYEQLVLLCRLLLDEYSALSAERIVGHSDVAPERKTDPGEAFDWALFSSLLNQRSVPSK